MARHPDPKVSTIKQLYGSATHCAAPGCTEPLYRVVPELDAPVPNSTVAHICAASPEGPRYDSNMSAEDNRAASNLLLLCHFHSRLVDVTDSPFGTELLREWKNAQTEQGPGVSITDQQAQEILTISVHSEIHMQAETISLGGQWGGGGGAIGAGAVGGPGGDRIYIDADGKAPGGGGGAIVGKVNPPPDGRRASLGTGRIPGLDGGDSSISSSDGEVLVSAPGGTRTPYADRATSHRLTISAMFFADQVQLRENVCFVLGGGWAHYSVLNTPCDLGLVVVLIVEAGGVPEGSYSITLRMVDPEGRLCGTARFPVIVDEPGDVFRLPYWVPIRARVTDYGLYELTASTDVRELMKIGLAVRRVTDA